MKLQTQTQNKVLFIFAPIDGEARIYHFEGDKIPIDLMAKYGLDEEYLYTPLPDV